MKRPTLDRTAGTQHSSDQCSADGSWLLSTCGNRQYTQRPAARSTTRHRRLAGTHPLTARASTAV